MRMDTPVSGFRRHTPVWQPAYTVHTEDSQRPAMLKNTSVGSSSTPCTGVQVPEALVNRRIEADVKSLSSVTQMLLESLNEKP